MNEKTILCSYAIRTLRRKADEDYISARCLYFHELYDGFIYHTSQALEKYLKAILLFNTRSAKNINHNLVEAYNCVIKIDGLENILEIEEVEYIKKIKEISYNRYGESYICIDIYKYLPIVDKIIWKIRKYCIVFDFDIKIDNKIKNLRAEILKAIGDKKYNNNPKLYSIQDGHLETIINNKDSSQYEILTKNNSYFGSNEENQLFEYSAMYYYEPFEELDNSRKSILKNYIKI